MRKRDKNKNVSPSSSGDICEKPVFFSKLVDPRDMKKPWDPDTNEDYAVNTHS